MNFLGLRQTDRWIIAIAAAVFILSLAFIFDDRWLNVLYETNSTDLNPIGEISKVENDVRRRHGAALTWLPAAPSSPVYQGDRIFTGRDAKATLRISQGEEISIAPNSLVVVGISKNSLLLSIDYGSVKSRIDKDHKILISSKDGLTELSGNDAVIDVHVRKGEAPKVNVLQGSVHLKANLQTKTLTKNEVHEIKPALKIATQKPAPKPAAPPPEAEPEFLPLAENEAHIVPALVQEAPPPPTPPLPAPKFISPTPHFVLKEANSPRFSWTAVDNAEEYELEISKRADFRTLESKHKLSSTDFIWERFDFGSHYARVRALKADNTGRFSKPFKFKVSLTPPRSLVKHTELSEDVPELNLLDMPPPPFALKWSPQKKSSVYELQFSSDDKFKEPLRMMVDRAEKQVQAPTPGSYYWRVRSLGPNKEPLSSFSEVFKISFSRDYRSVDDDSPLRGVYPKALQSIVVIGGPEEKIQFRWISTFAGKNIYRLQIATDADFEKPIFEITESKNWILIPATLPEGWLYWRVRAEHNSHETPWSTAMRFELIFQNKAYDINAPLLKAQIPAPQQPPPSLQRLPAAVDKSAPELSPPDHLQGVDVFRVDLHNSSNNVPFFKWTPPPPGIISVLEISKDEDFKQRVLSRALTQASFDWISYSPGRFFWRVASKNARGKMSEFSSPKELQIILEPPENLSPEDFSEHTPLLQWSPRPFATQYELEFSPDPDLKRIVNIKSKTNSKRVKVSKDGSYYWRIRALDKKGKPVSEFSTTYRTRIFKTGPRAPAQQPVGDR